MVKVTENDITNIVIQVQNMPIYTYIYETINLAHISLIFIDKAVVTSPDQKINLRINYISVQHLEKNVNAE